MALDEGKVEALRHQYSEANSNLRHYSTLRFAIFTVYFAIIGGVIALGFGVAKIHQAGNVDIRFWAKCAGLLVSASFATLEVICERYLRHFQDVLEELEQDLDYKQMATKPTFRFPKAYHATWGLYISLITFFSAAVILDLFA